MQPVCTPPEIKFEDEEGYKSATDPGTDPVEVGSYPVCADAR